MPASDWWRLAPSKLVRRALRWRCKADSGRAESFGPAKAGAPGRRSLAQNCWLTWVQTVDVEGESVGSTEPKVWERMRSGGLRGLQNRCFVARRWEGSTPSRSRQARFDGVSHPFTHSGFFGPSGTNRDRLGRLNRHQNRHQIHGGEGHQSPAPGVPAPGAGVVTGSN